MKLLPIIIPIIIFLAVFFSNKVNNSKAELFLLIAATLTLLIDALLTKERIYISLVYEYRGIKISYVHDRGYIEGEVIKDGTFIPFSKINPLLTNLRLSIENINLIIDFLARHKDELFPEDLGKI